MHELVHDLRFALRALRRRPALSVAAVAILSLGLAAGIAVFTYINAFYQPFPGVEADGLVRLFGFESDTPYQDISFLDYLDYASADAFEGMAASQPYYAASVRLETMTEVAFLEAVTGNFFSVLGIETSVGRGLTIEDDRPGAEAAVVISHAWWRRSFEADPGVIGSTIYLNFRPFVVVGVAQPEFLGTADGYRPDAWIPIAPFRDRYTSWAARAENRDIPLVRVYARLRPGAREQIGLQELRAIAEGLDEAHPRPTEARRLRLEPATWIDPSTRLAETPTLRLMVVTASVLLLLVCANVGNLLLSLALGRQRELSMRAALGASPARLVRQILTENLLLSAVAGTIALLLAGPAGTWIGSYFAIPSVWGANVAREVSIDQRVVLFALAISFATGVLAGILPAIRASRCDLMDSLTVGADLTTSVPRRIRGWKLPSVDDLLVTTQVALAVVLLVVAGLMIRTLVTVEALEPGFDYDRLVVTHISTSSTTLQPSDRERFFREVAARLGEEPWVSGATVADYPLLSPHRSAELRPDGQSEPSSLVYSMVIPGFFETLGIPVIRGRSIAANDTTGHPNVAVVNESFARRYFDVEQAVGRRVWWSDGEGVPQRAYEIVGVVRDTKTRDFLGEFEPTVYFSYPQHDYPTGSALLVSTVDDPARSVPALQRWLRDFEPHLAIVNVVTYPDVVSGILYSQRMNAEMFSALALAGLVLAAVGIFSLMSLAVGRRTREIGIRMAIGADNSSIARLVMRRAALPVVLGVGVGLAASAAVAGLVRGLLFGIEPTDPVTVAGGIVVLTVVALLAAYLPARRAAALDPMAAIRTE